MLSSLLDSWLARWSAVRHSDGWSSAASVSLIDTRAGSLRLFDSASAKPCVVFVPDGPNVVEHYATLTRLLASELRVVCFDMPGFGFSLPERSYRHSLDQGANAVLAVLDRLEIASATLAFSCANGFYALRAARMAAPRISSLFLSQTPSLDAMHAWTNRVIPWPLRVPVVGQTVAWLSRHKAAHGWYDVALPKTTDREPFRQPARQALAAGGCFCLAGVVQGLSRESAASIQGVSTPCTMIWGDKDRSHRYTKVESLLECVPHAEIVHFDDCGHFPDLEAPERYAKLLLDHVKKYA
jgi:pimeloyl-ACP methyl ester carboxylesterase